MESSDLAAHAQKLIDLTLRYVGSGGAAVLAFGAAQTPAFAFLRVSGGSDLSSWLILLYVVVVGPAIYAIHRSVIHPFILAGILYVRKRRFAPKLSVHEVDVRIGECVATGRAQNSPWISTNDAWTAQVHFLYCASLGIALALGLHYLMDAVQFKKHVHIGIAVMLVLFIPAIWSDWRLNLRQLERTFPRGLTPGRTDEP